MKKIVLMAIYLISQTGFSQAKKCNTWVHNLTYESNRLRNICFDVKITERINLNEFTPNRPYRAKDDCWRFSVDIKVPNEGKSQHLEFGTFLYEDNEEIKQYNSNDESYQIQALIFHKGTSSWQILMKQNEEYKILSKFQGYHYLNCFGIKGINKSFDY